MDSCVDRCCFGETLCKANGMMQINIAGFHKVCAEHYENIKYLDYLHCKYCRSVCKVTLDFLPATYQQEVLDTKACPTCFSKVESQYASLKSCGHIHCTQCMNNCKNIITTTTSRGKFSVCPNCSNSNCKEFELRCKHKGCLGCYSTECKECKKIAPKCKNCQKETRITVNLQCDHQGCENCFDSFCRQCNQSHSPYWNPNNTEKRCENCKYWSIPRKLECGHNGCLKCSAYSRECNDCKLFDKCSNCNDTNLSTTWRECTHRMCLNCSGKPQKCIKCFHHCRECKNYFNSYDLFENNSICTNCIKKHWQMQYCSNCKIKNDSASQRWENCPHLFCDRCNIPEKCKICFEKCLQCGNYTHNNELAQRKICIKCFDSFLNFEKCDICQTLKLNLKNLNCVHKICMDCQNQNRFCEVCNKKCMFCGSYSILRKLNCGHDACNACSKNEECLKCVFNTNNRSMNKVDNCFKCGFNKSVFGILLCGHSICLDCVDNEVKIFDYKCHHCSLTMNMNYCISCCEPYQWVMFEDLYYKKCCNKFFCGICRNFKEFHKC